MNVTTAAEASSYTITGIRNSRGSHDYLFVVGFCAIVLFTITYISYKCKHSQPPPDTADEDVDDLPIRFSRGLDHDILVTFPTSVYSETTMDAMNVVNGSGCSICLVDYIPADVVQILPECGHLFHVRCVDTWLKSHPTCLVCRHSPMAGVKVTKNQ